MRKFYSAPIIKVNKSECQIPQRKSCRFLQTTTYKDSPACEFHGFIGNVIGTGLFLFFTATYAVNSPLCSPVKDNERRIPLDHKTERGLTHPLRLFETQEGRENSVLTDSKPMRWGIKKGEM